MGVQVYIIKDSSNEPTLKKDDIIITSDVQTYSEPGFYIIKYNDSMDVVRVNMLVGGEICICQDNCSNYRTVISMEKFLDIVCGKVLWVCSRYDISLSEEISNRIVDSIFKIQI